jgi:hypothetical protein
MKRKSPKLSQFTASVVGNKYELGKVDCFKLIIDYLREQEVPLPIEFKGLTLDSYKDYYQKDPLAAKETMLELMNELLSPIDPNKAIPGDIVLIKLRGQSSTLALAIEGGNSVCITAAEKQGVVALPLKYYRKLRGWSLCQF